MKRADPFAATDALLNGTAPGESLFVINLCAANMPQAIDASSVRAWGISGLEVYKLYQVSRMEDGRTRYRVRLGFFTSEADAELVLQSVRGKFATAFTSGLCDEDIKHASGYLKKPLHEIQEIQDTQRTGRYRMPKFNAQDLPPDTASTSRQPVLKATPTIARAASAMLTVDKPAAALQKRGKASEEIVEFEWTPDAKAAPVNGKPKPEMKVGAIAPKAVPASAKPTMASLVAAAKAHSPSIAPRVNSGANAGASAGINLAANARLNTSKSLANAPLTNLVKPVAKHSPPPATLQLAPAPAPKPTTTPRPSQPYHAAAGRSIPDHGLSLANEAALKASKSAPPTASAPMLPRPLVSAAALSKLRAAAAQPRNPSTEIPTLDTTQTIRTLTKTEIEDANAPKWYVVQLAISDHPANLDTMPRLDIFQAYCLYSVAVMDNKIIRHALRLGFFSEQVSAEAVMGYVKTFFGEPSIERISDSEQKRFGESFALREPPPAPVEPPKAAARVIPLEEKRPSTSPLGALPTVKPVRSGVQSRSTGKYAAPAVKRSAPLAAKKGNSPRAASAKITNKDLEEARLLGLSETAIRRVERNPSLLSRLVDKLTK
jgi:hypothetical protein